jgi:Pentapeptide repeats (8 copies)
MTSELAASFPSVAGVTAVAVAFIGAAATVAVGVFNYVRQGQTLQWQRDQQGRQIELMQSGQLTDRFARACDQLGSSSTPVRMGGIFGLERIARDSPGDRPHVVDTLAAFVREHLPASGLGDSRGVPELQIRAPDAQAALTVLCRSPLCDGRVASSETELLNLSRTDLRRANLQHARLESANLSKARLEGADLRWAHMENSNLEWVNFGRYEPGNPASQRGTDLSYANLTEAKLGHASNLDLALTEGTIGLPH